MPRRPRPRPPRHGPTPAHLSDTSALRERLRAAVEHVLANGVRKSSLVEEQLDRLRAAGLDVEIEAQVHITYTRRAGYADACDPASPATPGE